jgi:hypothetical protein
MKMTNSQQGRRLLCPTLLLLLGLARAPLRAQSRVVGVWTDIEGLA